MSPRLRDNVLNTTPCVLLLAGVLLIGLAGCEGRTSADSAVEDELTASNGEEVLTEAYHEAFAEATRRTIGAVPVVDHQALRALIPAEVAGLARVDLHSEHEEGGGFSVAQAVGAFGIPGEAIEVQIVDAGGVGILAGQAAAMMVQQVDRSTANGFERTGTFRGHPVYEAQAEDGADLYSDLQILVASRFFVNLRGRGVEVERLKEAASSIDLEPLEQMAQID